MLIYCNNYNDFMKQLFRRRHLVKLPDRDIGKD